MKLFFLVNILAAVTSTGIGLFVFLRKKNTKNRLYLIFNLNLAGWAIAMLLGLQQAGISIEKFPFWVRVATAIAVFIPAVFYHFVATFREDVHEKKARFLFYYLISGLLVCLAFTPSFIKSYFFHVPEQKLRFASPLVVYGNSFVFVSIYVLGLLIISLVSLLRTRKRNSGFKRLEIDYVFGTVALGTAFVCLTSLVSPYIGIVRFTPLAPFSAVLMSGIIAYGIARHRILEVSFVLKRTTMYAILTVFLVLIYGVVVFMLNLLFQGRVVPVNLFIPNMIAAIAIAFIFSPVKEKIQVYLDKFFFRRRHQPEKVLSELSEILSSREDISRLLRLSLERIAPALKVKNVLIALRGNKEADNFFIGAMVGHGFRKNQLILDLNKESAFVKELARGDVLIRDELERMSFDSGRDHAVALLKAMPAEMSVPLMLKNELVGFLIMSQKENRKIFSKHDLEFLRTISGQLAMVINNAELFSQLQRAERLAAAGIIAAGMAHEIRNPLVSIKTFVQLLPEKFNDPEFRQTFTQIASQEVDRINRLLEDLLNFARPAQMQKKKTNLSETIEKSLFMLTNELAAREITVEKEYPAEDIFVEGDEAQLQRVFSNLFLNSIQAMENGGRLTVTASTSPYKQRFFIKIIDTGKGVPSENLARIFDPFFSTRTGGTGLGLAIAHNIVKEHGGEIEVQSVPNNGTAFTLEFPAAYLSALEEK
ncbi:MAG: ATP-binding protein [Candidatus Omnitrophota bacterium]